MQEKSFVLPFPPSGQQAWLDKVALDMKGKKTAEDFVSELEGIRLDPFETSNHGDLPLDRIFDQTLAGAKIKIEHAREGNSEILSFLEKGADTLFLEINGDIIPEDLCTGVHLDYIFTVFQVKNHEVASRFSAYLETAYEDKSIQAFVICEEEVIYPSNTLYVSLDISQNITQTLTLCLQKAEKSIVSEKPLRCIAHFTIGKDFLFTISTLRAFRILWENLLVKIGFEEDIPLIVMSSPQYNQLSQDPNQALIESSYSILAAILGNVDISLSSYFPTGGHSYALRAYLIHQIFKEEGKLFTVKDPAAGSYYIEQATRKIASKVWDVL